MTITLDEGVYEGLYRMIGRRRMSQFIEDLVRPHVVDTLLDENYRAMAADKGREAEAMGWCNTLLGDMADLHGEVCWVEFEPAIGSEISKQRPAV